MKKINVRSFWIKKKNIGFIKEHFISEPKKSEALIKTVYSGISYGTERIVFTGSVPKNQIKMMKCPYQEGEFGSDVKYGYLNKDITEAELRAIKYYDYILTPYRRGYHTM